VNKNYEISLHFANYLCDRGFVVVGNDHLGHGESVLTEDEWGYFAKRNGRECVLNDLYTISHIIKERYPNLPFFLLGHSMGSFFARQYFAEYGKELTGIIIMGTGYQPRVILSAGMTLAKLLSVFKGWHHRSKFVNNMAFGSYNKKFEDGFTAYDWLSRDRAMVAKYCSEPKCQFMFTLNGYHEMFRGLKLLTNKEYINKMPKDKPVLFISGADDPVGNFGKGVTRVAKEFAECGVKDIRTVLYPEARHEVLNEINRSEVYQDIYEWLATKMQ